MMNTSMEPPKEPINHPYHIQNRSEQIPNEQLEQSIQIPQLNLDDWEVIAGFSGCEDLVHLADVCVDARKAAQLVFKRKFALKLITLQIDVNLVKLFYWSEKQRLRRRFDEKKNRFNRSDMCLKFLRVFGNEITNLEIELSSKIIRNNMNRCQQIIDYVNKFCAGSHKKVIFRDCFAFLFEQPMQNVGELEIYTAEPNRNIGDIEIHVLHFKVKWNETQIDLYINDKEDILFQLIRPQQFEKMKLNYGRRRPGGLTPFLRKFENIKDLTLIIENRYPMDKFIDDMPQMESLQICVHGSNALNYEQTEEIISSATAQSLGNLLNLSFHFQDPDRREGFLDIAEPLVTFYPWTITKNDIGLDGYRYTLILIRNSRV